LIRGIGFILYLIPFIPLSLKGEGELAYIREASSPFDPLRLPVIT